MVTWRPLRAADRPGLGTREGAPNHTPSAAGGRVVVEDTPQVFQAPGPSRAPPLPVDRSIYGTTYTTKKGTRRGAEVPRLFYLWHNLHHKFFKPMRGGQGQRVGVDHPRARGRENRLGGCRGIVPLMAQLTQQVFQAPAAHPCPIRLLAFLNVHPIQPRLLSGLAFVVV